MRQMKDSGVYYLGSIPSEWTAIRFRFLHDGLNTGESIDKDYWSKDASDAVFYTAGLEPIHTSYDEFPKWKLTKANDLLLARNGTPYIYLPITSSCYTDHIIRAAIIKDVDRRFVRYCLQISIDSVAVDSVSLVTWSASIWNEQVLALPNSQEQQRIADFLDRKCAEIDRIIADTQKTIEEYKALKQSIITEAVTKGIRGNRPMKDSGIEWFPVIPKDWSVSRVGLHFDIILGKMLCNSQMSADYTLEPYFCAADVHFSGISTDELKTMWFSPVEKEQYRVSVGDLLVVEGGAGAGGCAIVNQIDFDAYIQNSVMIVRERIRNTNRFLRYLIESLVRSGYIDIACNKATIPHFTKDKLARVPFLLSDEAGEIADYLDVKISQIDDLISTKERIIDNLESYKKSLIYEYVTGKKEVV